MSDPALPEGPIEAKVKWYNGRKGFGFVLGPDGQDVFFHASALTQAGIDPPPETDDILTCEIGADRIGRRLVTRIVDIKRGPGGRPSALADRPPRREYGDRPPRRDFSGGGFGDRPPRRDFGGGFGDRPPRRDFGGFGDRPPRRDFGDRPARRDIDQGGPTYQVTGTVKWFDTVRGFGFVTPDDGGQDVFLHSSVLQRAGRTELQQGEKIELDVRDGQRGRQAVTVRG
ncbi:MAG: cold shock domain-containing protein [Rhodovarius sp.]|nr:cold shock domain-containing protein [Rhodovarius sp.]